MLKLLKNLYNNHLYLISQYVRQVAVSIVVLIIARYLSVYDFGLFSSYKNIVEFCLMFTYMGISDFILVSSKANANDVRTKIAFFLFNALCISLLIASITKFLEIENHLLFVLIIFRCFFESVFFAIILPYFQATKTFNNIAKVNIFYSLGIAFIAIISYFFRLSLLQFLALNIYFGFFNFVICSRLMKIKISSLLNSIKNFFNIINKDTIIYSMSAIAYFLYSQLPLLYISIFQQ